MTRFNLEDAAAIGQRVEARWDAQRAERNLGHARARRRARVVRTRLAAGLGVLSALVAALLVLRARPSADVAAHAPAPPAPASPVADHRTTFADGSTARVSDGGKLVVQSATEQRIEAVLVAGAADFEVTKRPSREFFVQATPIRVRVVGTRFRVELAGERARVVVAEGKVEVLHGDARAFLEAGESRWFPGTEPSPKADDAAPAAASTDRTRFLELARAERFTDAYQVMTRSPSAVGGSAEELMLAADAARHSNHPEQALGYLRRVTREHAADSRAPLAAFTLGRLLLNQLGRPAEAADAFALVARLQPSGGLVEDALARQAEALAAAGEPVRAGRLAAEYVARYPRGKHLSTMQRLSARQ